MGRRIIVKDIVELSGMSFQTVKKRLYDASVEPLGEDGKSIVYDSVAALRAVFCPVQQGSQLAPDDHKALLIQEQWREKKRENDMAERVVGPFSLITETISKAGEIVIANLEALPAEMKRSNPELMAADINTVKKIISRCCQAISEMKIPDND